MKHVFGRSAIWLLLVLPVLASGASPKSEGLPHVVDESEAVGLRCAQASTHYTFNLPQVGDQLQSSLVTSPNGGQVAAIDPRGTRILSLESGRERVIENVVPLTWSADSRRLFLLHTDRKFYSLEGNLLRPEPWLDEFLSKALLEGADDKTPELYFAGNGLIVVPFLGGRFLLVASVENQATISIAAAWQRLPARTFSELRIGWNQQRLEPAIFVVSQDYRKQHGGESNPHKIVVEHFLDIYRPDGSRAFTTALQGPGIGIAPLLLGDRALLLSHLGDKRCVNSVDREGKVRPYLSCATDIEFAHLSRNGELLAAKSYFEVEPHNELMFSRNPIEVSRARHLAALPDGTAMYVIARAMKSSNEVVFVKNGNVTRRLPISERECVDRDKLPNGIALRAPAGDGLDAHGWLFVPAAKQIKGLLVHAHGGPRIAERNVLHKPFKNGWLDRGYAFVAVNYRGGTGYGRELLEAPYGKGVAGMLLDIEAIRQAALSKLSLPKSTPAILHGVSYGGFLAIQTAIEKPNAFRAFIIDSAVCKLNETVDNVSSADGPALPLSSVRDPEVGIHELRISTDLSGQPLGLDLCSNRIGGDAKVVLIHARGDPNASFESIEEFGKKQDQSRLMSAFAVGVSHDPMFDLSQDPAAFKKIFDAIVEFVEKPPESKLTSR